MTSDDRVISACNFRDSGLLSNESTRYLRSLHEGFARAVSHSLDLFLGAPLELKLDRVEQVGVRTFSTQLTGSHYLMPLTVAPLQERVVVGLGHGLLFRLLDLLLGGSGEVTDLEREVTEIDEELFRSVMEVLCLQLERVWKACEVAVAMLPSIKPAVFDKLFANEERLLVLRFVLHLGEWTEEIVMVLPSTFGAALVQSVEAEDGRNSASLVAGRRLETRLLQCLVTVSVDLCGNRVPLGELVALQQGSILDLQTPSDTPIQLRLDGHPIFDAMPVKNGRDKAAQLMRPLPVEEGA
jgi:flagellar motor switch protein FliM